MPVFSCMVGTIGEKVKHKIFRFVPYYVKQQSMILITLASFQLKFFSKAHFQSTERSRERSFFSFKFLVEQDNPNSVIGLEMEYLLFAD